MRENLERPSDLLLNYFLPDEIEKVVPLVPKIRQVILEQETDTLVLIKLKNGKEFILHWEFETKNDPRMARRMASYDFMIHLKYGLDVRSLVIYIGSAPMNIKTTVDFNGNYYNCKVIDIRDINPELFLASENPKEIILALLAGNDENSRELIIERILIKLQALLPGSQSELKERITQLEIISLLRGEKIHKQILKKKQKMTITYDIRKLHGYKEGVSRGEARALITTARNMIKEGLSIQLIHKTTSLPMAELEKLFKESK